MVLTNCDYAVPIGRGLRELASRIFGRLVVEYEADKGQGPRDASWILPPCEMNTSKITQCHRFSRYHAGSEGVCDGHHRQSAKIGGGGGGLLHPLVTIRELSNGFSLNLVSDSLIKYFDTFIFWFKPSKSDTYCVTF